MAWAGLNRRSCIAAEIQWKGAVVATLMISTP
jgi:hypothetical protein